MSGVTGLRLGLGAMPPPTAMTLRSRLIRLAHAQPSLRGHLLPLLRKASPPTLTELRVSALGLLAAYCVALGDAAREAALTQAPDDAPARLWLDAVARLQRVRALGQRELQGVLALLGAVKTAHPEARWLAAANAPGVLALSMLGEVSDRTALPEVNAPLRGDPDLDPTVILNKMATAVAALADGRPLAAEAINAAWLNR